MSNHFQFKRYRHKLQMNYYHYHHLMAELYQKYCPLSWRERRNIKQSKISDVTCLTLLGLQAYLGIASQRKFVSFLQTFLPHKFKIERSRFNRRARQLLPAVNAIRNGLTRDYFTGDSVVIIDSFPLPLCQPIRRYRAKIFKDYANQGYNATKKMWFYGFKAHLVISASGYVLNYAITAASVHDVTAAPELIANCPCPNVLADVGYVGQKLQDEFDRMGYHLWTPYRSNMRGAKEHNKRNLKQLRRTIETRFSVLVSSFGIENIRMRSLSGFQLQFELILLTYNLGFFEFTTN